MIAALLSLYLPGYAKTIVYMLQSTEYRVWPYLQWYWRTNNFRHVARRRTLDYTKAARLLLAALRLGMAAQLAAGAVLIWLGAGHHLVGGVAFGAAVILATPVLWAHLVTIPLLIGRWVVVSPNERRQIVLSEKIFANHKGTRIAVAGSYGKTTMKEILATVLGAGKKVAATPGNKNVAVSHAAFARALDGDEDVLIIEYGEGRSGDVARFAATTHPDIGVITGLAPAHLDQYKTLAAAGKDILTLADYLNDRNVYINGESPDLQPFIKPAYFAYTADGVMDWQVKDVRVRPDGLDFKLKKGTRTLNLTSGLVGRHQIGPLALATALANELGLSKKEIEAGVAHTKPFEHRMQPQAMAGAWVIDDTYNGNIEGIRAGTALLKEVEAKQKIYVTPGLVDQGHESERVHKEMGRLIAEAHPTKVVLMKNSVTKWIESGLTERGYEGEITIEPEPLNFYTNLPHFLSAGDVVLMQNDWTDNYA